MQPAPLPPPAPATQAGPPTTAQILARLRAHLERAPRGTAARLARTIGVSRQQLNAWLHTHRKPNADHLLAILHALKQPAGPGH